MEKPVLLSIVVPTKNRYKYLKYLIDLVAGFHSDEVELVIQDNSDDNSEFVSYLNRLNYPFIRYDYVKGQIPMAVNSDKAILNSTGEFVCFLGDDDGLTRYTIDCARWMKENDVEAVKSTFVYYNWPDSSQSTEGKESSTLVYNKFDGKIKYRNANVELIRVLKSGIVNKGNMPLVYHSIVSRNVLDKVYDRAGSFFPGNSPDIANAVALSLVVVKFAIVNIPLAFSGCSVFHGGGVHANGKKGHPEITEVPWFRSNAEQNWDKRVPRIAAGSLIWADSAISALKFMNREDLYSKINFNKMYANFAINNPNYKNRVDDVCSNKFTYFYSVAYGYVTKYVSALMRRIGNITGCGEKQIIKRNITDILKATEVLEEMIKTLSNPSFIHFAK